MGALSKLVGGGSSKSYVDPAQAPFLNFIRNQGQGIAGSNTAGASKFAANQGADLFNFGRESLSQLQNNPFLDSLQQQAGGNPALLNAQIGQLGSDLGRTFEQQILPGIRRDATAIGALGGSRQGVAEGLAGQGLIDAFQRGAVELQGQDAQRALQAGVSGGGLLGQGLIGGIAGASDLFGGVGLGQFTGGFAPLSVFNSLVGPPNVLNKQSNSNGLASLGQLGQLGGTGGII